MSKRHENEEFIHGIQIFNGENIDFDEQIAQIEKVSNLTGKPEYIVALAKSSDTPYKTISQTPSYTTWNNTKKESAKVLFFGGNRCTCSHRFVMKTTC